MKIIVLVTVVSVLAGTSLAGTINRYPAYGQKQEVPAGPPGVKVETSANEQQKQFKMETAAKEQGQPQSKIETSARQQGPPGVASVMQDKERMPEPTPPGIASSMQNKQRMVDQPNQDEQEVQAEHNEDLANFNQLLGVSWPYGRYAIPRPASGCPYGWSSGYRYSDNEDTANINSESTGVVTRMNVEVGSNTKMNYCVKNSAGLTSAGSWPRGEYCIARKGGSCPTGFTGGSVYWDDEDTWNANYYSGILPDGIYGFDTVIYFCCRSDGDADVPITLPTSTPFILYRFGTTCQTVSGMQVYEDYIFTDDEDNWNINFCTGSHPAGSCGRDIQINFCYYYKYY